MTTIASQLSPSHRETEARLARRADELRELLQSATRAGAGGCAEVTDFKDAAAEETRVAVDEVALAHAATEVEQVASALRRLREGSYGQCLDCGETIDARRLAALPATPYCTDCQALHEHAAPARR